MADVLTINTPQPIVKTSSGVGSVTLSGTQSGDVAIEARVLDYDTGLATVLDWTAIDASPSGGTFSGILSSIPEGGWYRIQCRPVGGGGTIDTYANGDVFGVGLLIALAGQSNLHAWTGYSPITIHRLAGGSLSSTASDPIRIYVEQFASSARWQKYWDEMAFNLFGWPDTITLDGSDYTYATEADKPYLPLRYYVDHIFAGQTSSGDTITITTPASSADYFSGSNNGVNGTNNFVNATIEVTGGTGVGQTAKITACGNDTLTLDSSWATPIDGTSTLSIYIAEGTDELGKSITVTATGKTYLNYFFNYFYSDDEATRPRHGFFWLDLQKSTVADLTALYALTGVEKEDTVYVTAEGKTYIAAYEDPSNDEWFIIEDYFGGAVDGWQIPDSTVYGRNQDGAIAFAKTISDETGLPVGLIQTSVGGTSLWESEFVQLQALHTSKNGLGSWSYGTGALYDYLHDTCLALGGINGLVWHQGENDARYYELALSTPALLETAADVDNPITYDKAKDFYIEKWNDLYDNITTDFGDIPIFISCIGAYPDFAPGSGYYGPDAELYWDAIEKANESLIRGKHNVFLGGYFYDLMMNYGDSIHADHTSYETMATRIANSYLQNTGYDVGFEIPKITKVSRTSSTETVVTLSTSNVALGNVSGGGNAWGFEVINDGSKVTPSAAVLSGNTVTLTHTAVTGEFDLRYAWGPYPQSRGVAAPQDVIVSTKASAIPLAPYFGIPKGVIKKINSVKAYDRRQVELLASPDLDFSTTLYALVDLGNIGTDVPINLIKSNEFAKVELIVKQNAAGTGVFNGWHSDILSKLVFGNGDPTPIIASLGADESIRLIITELGGTEFGTNEYYYVRWEPLTFSGTVNLYVDVANSTDNNTDGFGYDSATAFKYIAFALSQIDKYNGLTFNVYVAEGDHGAVESAITYNPVNKNKINIIGSTDTITTGTLTSDQSTSGNYYVLTDATTGFTASAHDTHIIRMTSGAASDGKAIITTNSTTVFTIQGRPFTGALTGDTFEIFACLSILPDLYCYGSSVYIENCTIGDGTTGFPLQSRRSSSIELSGVRILGADVGLYSFSNGFILSNSCYIGGTSRVVSAEGSSVMDLRHTLVKKTSTGTGNTLSAETGSTVHIWLGTTVDGNNRTADVIKIDSGGSVYPHFGNVIGLRTIIKNGGGDAINTYNAKAYRYTTFSDTLFESITGDNLAVSMPNESGMVYEDYPGNATTATTADTATTVTVTPDSSTSSFVKVLFVDATGAIRSYDGSNVFEFRPSTGATKLSSLWCDNYKNSSGSSTLTYSDGYLTTNTNFRSDNLYLNEAVKVTATATQINALKAGAHTDLHSHYRSATFYVGTSHAVSGDTIAQLDGTLIADTSIATLTGSYQANIEVAGDYSLTATVLLEDTHATGQLQNGYLRILKNGSTVLVGGWNLLDGLNPTSTFKRYSTWRVKIPATLAVDDKITMVVGGITSANIFGGSNASFFSIEKFK